jgi:nucleoside phosphorylase
VVTGGVGTAQCAFGNRAWGEALAREHGIVAVEMESAAVARACAERDVPFLAVRAVSDVIGRRWQWPAMVWNLVRVQRNAERLIYALAQFLDDEA